MAFKAQGGGEQDIEPTARLVRKAYQMGEPWIHWNLQTECYDVLVLRRQRRKERDNCWQLFA